MLVLIAAVRGDAIAVTGLSGLGAAGTETFQVHENIDVSLSWAREEARLRPRFFLRPFYLRHRIHLILDGFF